MERLKRLWLRQHGARERRLAAALQTFFDDQAARIVSTLRSFGHVAPSIVPQIFNTDHESKLLIKAAHPRLLRSMALGSHLELEANAARKAFKDAGETEGDSLQWDFQIPEQVLASMRHSLDVLEQQAFWLEIQRITEQRITDAILAGINSGEGFNDTLKRVRAVLSGAAAKKRADTIARTETTGAINAGHYVAREELMRQGLILNSEWLSMEDGKSRPAHAALDGVRVPYGQLFNVGGEQAPYPGYYGLSAAQRVNCRCLTVAGNTFAD